MERKRIFEKSDEEIIEQLRKRWQPANSLEEAYKIAEKQFNKFYRSIKDLRSVNDLFKRAPEIFLFKEFVNKIDNHYKITHTYVYGNACTQIDNFEYSLRKFEKVANKLYEPVIKKSSKQIESRVKK